MIDRVWYACYGSNLNYDRFKLYIKGGVLENSGKLYHGCRDKTLPERMEKYTIHHELYFSGESPTWKNLGVAFINTKEDPSIDTLSKIYLISIEQFEDVLLQENGKDPRKEKVSIDYDSLLQEKEYLTGSIDENRWYGRILHIGYHHEIPIFTFTAKWDYEGIWFNPPSDDYLITIIKGLIETHDPSNDELMNYFRTKKGMIERYDDGDLLDFISSARDRKG